MKKYDVIYADPPRSYNSKRANYIENNSWETAKYYKSMTLNDIKNLDVNKICNNDCILFIWITFPLIKEWIEVIESWWFKYKTIWFNWVKTYPKSKKICFGIWSYTRSNVEACLIGVKWKPKILNKNISNVIIADREWHSKKPDIIRSNIEKMCNWNKLELFARNSTEWWDVFWNQIENSIFIDKKVV